MSNLNIKRITLADDNSHLDDVLSNENYLELGTIKYNVLDKLLHYKLVGYNEISYFDIQSKGVGKSNISNDELKHKLPYIYFENLITKNSGFQAVITYGVYVQRRGYREVFTPMILIPVIIYIEKDDIYFQMVSQPIENQHLSLYRRIGEVIPNESLNTIYDIDKFCMGYYGNDLNNVRLESYLTYVKLKYNEPKLNNDLFNYEYENLSYIENGYNLDINNPVYNVTALNKNQRAALEKAHLGHSFAITGIKGTGKTVALANIASDAIMHGKKVLYVSNCAETIEQVYNIFKEKELESVIADFTKPFKELGEKYQAYNKRKIYEQVKKNELDGEYEGIEEYSNVLYKRINDFYFIDVINGAIKYKDVDIDIDEKYLEGLDHIYKLELFEIYEGLKKVDENMALIESFKNSRFNSIPITNHIDGADKVLDVLNDISNEYQRLLENKKKLENKYGFVAIDNYAFFRTLINNYHLIDNDLIPDAWLEVNENGKLVGFDIAKKAFSKFEEEMVNKVNKEKLLDLEYNVNNFDGLHLDNGIDLILLMFKGKEENYDEINKFLKDTQKILSSLDEVVGSIDTFESNLGKMRDRLEYNINYDDTQNLERLLGFMMFIDRHSFSKTWLDLNNANGIKNKIVALKSKLDLYESHKKLYLTLFSNISDIDNNILLLINKSKRSSKYRGMDVYELIEKFKELAEMEKNLTKTKVEYFDIVGEEYDINANPIKVFERFIKLINSIENKTIVSKIQKVLSSTKGYAIKDIIKPFVEFGDFYLQISERYRLIASYGFDCLSETYLDKCDEIKKFYNYVTDVKTLQNKVISTFKEARSFISFEEINTLASQIKELVAIQESINNNEKYKTYLGPIFKGFLSDVEEIRKLIQNFDLYISIFVNNEDLVATFDVKRCEIIDEIMNESFVTCENINESIKLFSRIFRESVEMFYYSPIEKMIEYTESLLDAKDELVIYLNITNGLRLVVEKKLNKFSDYIIDNEKVKFADAFMKAYFEKLFNNFLLKEPDLLNTEGFYRLLDEIISSEKDLIQNNCDRFKVEKNNHYTINNLRNMDYMEYVEKTSKIKALFLSNTSIINYYLDVQAFDLVLIDDAHLLESSEYYKAVTAHQVIVAGLHSVRVGISTDLISRMRKNNIIYLDYRYVKTPFGLLQKLDKINGNFYQEVDDGSSLVVTHEIIYKIVSKILINSDGTINNYKVNIFAKSEKLTRVLYDEIAETLLYNNVSSADVFEIFRNQISISDLNTGYALESDYNVLYLNDYYDIKDKFTIANNINILLCAKRGVVICDVDDLMTYEKKTEFNIAINNLFKPYHLLQNKDDCIVAINEVLAKHHVKTIGRYGNINILIEKKKKYYGITIFDVPSLHYTNVLNSYRDIYYGCEIPVLPIYLIDLKKDFNAVIEKILRFVTNA